MLVCKLRFLSTLEKKINIQAPYFVSTRLTEY